MQINKIHRWKSQDKNNQGFFFSFSFNRNKRNPGNGIRPITRGKREALCNNTFICLFGKKSDDELELRE